MTDLVRKAQGSDERVAIDGAFIRHQARDAVQQFFRPLTAPFQSERDTLKDSPAAGPDNKAKAIDGSPPKR